MLLKTEWICFYGDFLSRFSVPFVTAKVVAFITFDVYPIALNNLQPLVELLLW
jgi:hypothetical protein